MIDAILTNLINIGIGLLIYLMAYTSNIAFSIWYNVKMLNQQFEKDRLINSGLKLLMFSIGSTLLIMAITSLPIFAESAGWALPDEIKDAVSVLAIVGIVVRSAYKYIVEATSKMQLILNSDSSETENKVQKSITY